MKRASTACHALPGRAGVVMARGRHGAGIENTIMTERTAPPAAPPVDDDGLDAPHLAAAKLFVATVFIGLGAGFIASTALLILEFPSQWPTFLVAHSHLFIFFPTFGLLALMAFFMPSVVFTHLYWTHLPYGRARFVIGTGVVFGLTWFVTNFMLGPTADPRAVWEMSPRAMSLDRGDPVGCGTSVPCRRIPIMAAVEKLRDSTDGRNDLSRFARQCKPDPLLEPPEENERRRWCFPAGAMLNAGDCCKAQEAYRRALAERVAAPLSRSRHADWDLILQPVKIFFVLVVLSIGGMLVLWRQQIERHYPVQAGRIQRHVLIGGIAMLLWPIMDYAYLATSNVLFGKETDDLQLRLSLVVAPWALLLLFYFLRNFARNIEVLGQIGGVAGGLAALLVRDELRDWSVRFVGIGMPWWIIASLVALWITLFVFLFFPRAMKRF
jgi:hypothetical protein